MRPKSSRILRIEGEMQRVLAELIAREVKDPRVGSVTVTAVDLTADSSEARIYFLPFGPKHPAAEVSAGLTRAAGFLRGEVGRRLSLRHAPSLRFVLDEQFERASRLSALIDLAARRDAEAARDSPGDTGRADADTGKADADTGPAGG
jgi:ribosome-binding factor A